MKDKNILIEENYSSENPSISEVLLNKAFCNYSYFYKSCVPIPNVVSNKASHCLSIECFLITSIDGLFGPSHFLPSDGSAMSSWENAECSPQICFSIFNHNTLIWSSSPLQFPHEHQKWVSMGQFLCSAGFFLTFIGNVQQIIHKSLTDRNKWKVQYQTVRT